MKTKYNKVPVVRDAGATEVAVRPMDDVCPWEAVPGPSTEAGGAGDAVSSGRTADQARHTWDSGGYATTAHSAEAARASRKNSAQLDSCSSSSDVSLAIVDVSERLRKSCSLQHSGSIGTSGPGTMTRNYSTCSASGRIRLAEIGRASVSSCNYPSPQQSFEYSHAVVEKVEERSSLEKMVPEEEPVAEAAVVAKESQPSLKTSAKAPLISISAIVGDLPSDNSTMENAEEEASESCTAKDAGEMVGEERAKGEDSRADTGADVSPVGEEPATSEELPEAAQVVPVWEPDAQQEDRSAAAQAVPREKRDNNVNEVCPWEDEENCRVDAPYVKTYATLGYL